MRNKERKLRQNTIAKKMTKWLLCSTFIILTVIVVVIYMVIQSTVTKYNKKIITAETQGYVYQIESWKNEILTDLNQVARTIQKTGLMNTPDELLEYLKNVTIGLNNSIEGGVFIGGSGNLVLVPTGFVPDKSFRVEEREWYQSGLKVNTMTFGNPYIDVIKDTLLVSASMHLGNQMVAGADISLTDITNQIETLDVIGEGFGFLVDTNSNTIIAHPDTSNIGKKLEETDSSIINNISTLINKSDQIHEVKEGDKTYFVKISQIEGTNWSLVTCANKGVVFQSFKKGIYALIAASIFVILMLGSIISLIVRKMMSSIQSMTKAIENISEGDFSIELNSNTKSNDEISIMLGKLAGFIQTMRSTLGSLTQITTRLSNESDKTQQASVAISDSTNVQAEAMQMMNTTVEEIARSIEECADQAMTLAQSVADVSQNGIEATEYMSQSVTAVEAGTRDIAAIADKMENIDQVMQQLDTVVHEVGTSMGEINQITAAIGEIASQTNLLALNASIEAARAGEAGKGFAVVATEIGTLAASSAEAVKNINQLITKISSQVDAVVAKTEESVTDISNSKTLVSQTSEAFTKINETVTHTSQIVTAIAGQIQEMDEVAASMAAITEEQASSTEEILANSESLFQQATQISDQSFAVQDTSKELNDSVLQMKKQMEFFKIS